MSHNTSLFAEILKLIPANVFKRIVKLHGGDRYAKGFTCHDQLVSMLFLQFARLNSLREISDGLRVTCGKLNHLGMKKAPSKSTLSYANEHRSFKMYEDLFYTILEKCMSETNGKKQKFRFENKLYSMDATVIDLCASAFPWAHFRQTKGAVKLHTILDHDGYLPVFMDITEGSRHEVKVAHEIEFPSGCIVTMDRGYFDYELFNKWDEQGVFFVTRLKSNTPYEVIESYSVPEGSNISSDEDILLTSNTAAKKCSIKLRRVCVRDAEQDREYVLLTNKMDLVGKTIAAIYKDRWEIELFFKCLKQNFRIRTFVGTNANALKIQIWTALITLLLTKLLQFRSKTHLPLCRLLAILRLNLFTYRSLMEWLNDPFTIPEQPPEPEQLSMAI